MSTELPSRASTADPVASSPSARERGLPEKWMMLVVLLLTFAAYAPTLHYQFVHDDQGQIVDNPSVQSWSHFPEYFTRQVWAGYTPGVEGNYYRPVFLIWLRLNDVVFGLHPWGWHLTSILTHLITTLLVYFLAKRLTGDILTAGIAALLFGLHPVHIEGVTWVSGVTEPLLSIFFILAFLCYLKAREKQPRGRPWLVLSLFLFVVAMLEKETGVIFPMVIVAYEWFDPEKDASNGHETNLFRRGWKAILPALPYFALVGPYLAARIHALHGFSHPLTPMPISTVLMTMPLLLAFWIRHFAWPAGLSTFYDVHAVSRPTYSNFAIPAVVVIILTAIAIVAARKSRTVAFSLAWIVLPLLPLLDIRVFARNEFAHDRYLYVPSVGLVILAALALRRIPAGRLAAGLPGCPAVALLLLTPVMMFGVIHEGSYFASPRTFYAHCARTAPGNSLAVTDYAADLGEQGKYAEAASLLKGIVSREPEFWFANYNLALTYYRMGQLAPSEDYFRRAINLRPEVPGQYLYLGLIEMKTGRMGMAEDSIRRSLQLDPGNYGSHFGLAIILRARGDLSGALKEMQAEAANYPNEAAARQQVIEIQAEMQKRR